MTDPPALEPSGDVTDEELDAVWSAIESAFCDSPRITVHMKRDVLRRFAREQRAVGVELAAMDATPLFQRTWLRNFAKRLRDG